MKKTSIFTAVIVFGIALLTACIQGQNNTASTQESECTNHVWGEYQFDKNDHWRELTCGCSLLKETEKHVDENNDDICDKCSYNYYYPDEYNQLFSDHYPWILDINPEDVSKIQITHHIMNSELGTYDNVYSIYDKASISDFIDQFRSLSMYMIAGFEPGFNSSKMFYDFVLNDGTTYSFYTYCGFLDGLWELKYIPSLTKYPSVENAYSFVLYLTFGQVYEYNNPSDQICCMNNTDDFKFVLIDSNDAPNGEPTHFIKINHTTLYVLNSNTFYYTNEKEEKIYCRLTTGDFYQMFDDFSVNYQLLIDAFLRENPELTSATVDKYFGTTESGAIMALITSPQIDYPGESATEWIDGTPIKNYFKVFVLYENKLYSVGTAFRNGIITKNDVKTIYQLQ